jgi:hypothetical protein
MKLTMNIVADAECADVALVTVLDTGTTGKRCVRLSRSPVSAIMHACDVCDCDARARQQIGHQLVAAKKV